MKQRKCQTRWKDDEVGFSGREYQRQLIDEENKGKILVASKDGDVGKVG